MSSETCTACCQRAPVLTGEEIALLQDAGALVGMRAAPEITNVGLEACRLVRQRQQGAAVERVQVTCLVRLQSGPVHGVGSFVFDHAVELFVSELATVPMTTLERELLLNLGALHAPGPADADTIQQIMEEAFDNNTPVFELAVLGPRAHACYMDALAASMLASDDDMDA